MIFSRLSLRLSKNLPGIPFALGLLCLMVPAIQATHPGEDTLHSNCHVCTESEELHSEIYKPSPDVFETYPDGTVPKPASDSDFSTMNVTGPIAPAAGQPPGALTGRIVYTSAGHGWIFNDGSWGLQRPVLHEMNEDYGTLDEMNIFAQYAFKNPSKESLTVGAKREQFTFCHPDCGGDGALFPDGSMN